MLTCQAVTIGRDVRGVVSLAWGGGARHGWWQVSGQWSITPRNPSPRHPSRQSPPRTCPSSMLNYTVWTAGFCPVSGTFVLIGNRPIIGRLFGTDYRPTDNRPVRYRCIPKQHSFNSQFPGQPGWAGTRTPVLHCIAAKTMEMAVTDGAIRRAKHQPNHHHQQTNTQLFTDCTSFLSLNQQVSKQWEEKYHIPRTCSSQAHLQVFQSCLDQ